MADINSNININLNTATALTQLRSLQAALSKFHQTLAEGNLAAANAQKGLNAQLIQSIGISGKFAAGQVKVASSTHAFTTALEKNKLSLREYYRYSMAAATANTKMLSRAFAQEREIINRARRDRVKALQSQYIQLAKAQNGFIDALRVMPRTLQMANGRFTELGTRIQYAAQRQQFLNQLLKQGSTSLLNFGKNTQWAGRQLMVGLTLPLTMLGAYASRAFRDLEEATVKFRRVYGDAFTNDAEVEVAVQNIRKLANEFVKYGVAVKDTMDMAATAAAAGFTGKALEEQVKTASKLAVLGQIEQQQALETTISLQNAFGLSTEELAKKIDFLNAVENQTVVSIEDLTIAIPKAAPVIKQLGGNVEDLAFFLTAMKEGGINASEGANALKSGLASLINPTEKASKMLAGFGINIKGIVEANKGDIKGTVVGFARALDTLDPLNRARAIEQLFGKFQFARLSTLFQNVTKEGSQASRAFDLAGKSVEELAILSERELGKVQDAVGVKFQAAVEQFKQDIMPLGKAFLEAMTPIVKFFGDLFKKFNNLSDGTKKIVTVIIGVLAGIGPIALMTFGLLANGLANLIKLFANIRGGIARLNGQTNILGAGFNYVTQEQIEQQAAGQALHNTHTRLVEVFGVETTAAMQLAQAYRSLSSQMHTMATQNPSLFVGGAAGARAAVSRLPKGVKKYKEGILSVPGPKGAGDIQPAMLAPGESVIPAKTSEKYRGLITAIFKDDVPGFMGGRLPWNTTNPHPARQSGAEFIGMPKGIRETSQSRQIIEKIAENVKKGRYGSTEPTDFGTLLQSFSGRSFPVPGIGGVYRKPSGELVVVKPTMDERTALAEVRATQIARDVHGLVAPKQTIRTMIDPTDPAKQRKLIVLESPYDPRIAGTTGKFTKKEMVTQLVASLLRADKDLQKANLSGRVLADVGNAGVFDRASGFRDFAKALPSMEEQAMINLLGIKGGAKKFFAQETSGIASNMTPKQYHDAIIKEIDKILPKLKDTIKSFDLDPVEKIAYNNMIKRLEDGKKVDWSKFQAIHSNAGAGVKKYITGNDAWQSDDPMIRAAQEKFRRETQNVLAIGGVPTSRIRELQQIANNKNIVHEAFSAKNYKPLNDASQTQLDKLIKDIESDFSKELTKLYAKDPKRARIIETAWRGGQVDIDGKVKTFSKPRQSAFRDYLKGLVYIDGKYYAKKDIELGRTPQNSGRTYQELVDSFLHRAGFREKNGELVAGGKFTGRFMSTSAFDTDVRTAGKEAGGGLGVLSETVRPIARKERKAWLAKVGDPLTTSTGKYLKKLGYSDDKIRYWLRPELSHLTPTSKEGIGGRESKVKYSTGLAGYDIRLVNNFMNNEDRHRKLLEWNNKRLQSGQSGFLTFEESQRYMKAAEFMSKGKHPVTRAERQLVAMAAEIDQRADVYNRSTGSIPKALRPEDIRIPQAVQKVLGDKRFKMGSLMDLSAKDAGSVLVRPGEYKYNTETGEITRLTTKNTKAKPAGVKPSTGKKTDSRLTKTTSTSKVLTGAQAARVTGGRPSMVLPGRDDGEKLTPLQQQRAKRLRARGFTENQISAALRAQEKHDRKIEKLKGREAAVRAKEVRRLEQEPKRLAAVQRQTDRVNAAHVEALKMNQKFDEAAAKTKAKELRQQNKIIRQEKVGRFSGGASMALGTAGMAAMMSGNTGMGMGLMGASAVAGMAPMFAGMGPIGIAITGIVALGAVLLLAKKNFESMVKKQVEYVNSVSATTDKMKKIGEITGKVGASELYAKKRQESSANRYTASFERGRSQFGTTFFQSEVGKGIKESFIKDMSLGTEAASQRLALQLSAYISDGILTAEQSYSIARQIGLDLGNMTLGTNIQGKVTAIVGPDGKNLLTDPLTVRMNIIKGQQESTNTFLKAAESSKNTANWWQKILGLTPGEQAKGFGGTATAASNELSIIQAQRDAQNKKYEDEIRALEVQKAATTDKAKQLELEGKIRDAKKKQKEDDKAFAAKSVESRNRIGKIFDIATKEDNKNRKPGDITLNRNAVITASKEAVKAKYTGDQAPLAEAFLAKTKQLQSEKLEVILNTVVGGGDLDVVSATNLLNIFGKKEKLMQTKLNTALELNDPGGVQQLLGLLGGLGLDQQNAQDLFINIATKDPEQFDNRLNALNLLSQLQGKEINLKVFLKDGGKKLDKLGKLLDKVDKDLGKKPITLTVLQDLKKKNPDMPDLSALIADWDKWKNETPEIQKSVVTTYLSIYDTIDKSEVDAYIAKNNINPNLTSRKAIRSRIANELLPQQPTTTIPSKDGEETDQQDNESKVQASVLDELLKKLRDVRKLQIKVTEGWDASIKSLNNLFSGSKVIQGFNGLEQRLRSLGAQENFIDLIIGMDPKEFETRKKQLFEIDNKGNIKSLKQDALSVQEALNSMVMGDFQSAVERQNQELKNQSIAFSIVSKLGLSVADSYELVADKALAATIATAKNEAAMKRMIREYKAYIEQSKKYEASKNVQSDIADATLEATQRDRIQRNFSQEDTFAIFSDKNLRELEAAIEKQKIKLEEAFRSNDERDIFNAQSTLNKMVNDFNTRLNQLKSTIEYMQGLFDDGYNKAMEAFDAQETAIQLRFERSTLADQGIIQKAQDDIALIQYDIDNWQANLTEIEKEEDKINKAYDERLNALDNIAKINARIAQQQQSQLTIADALSQGDISAAAKAVQESRAQTAQGALDDQRTALEQARTNALKNITSNGYTRLQIETKIQELQDKILKIEEDQLEPAVERVRLAEIEKRNAIEGIKILGKSKLEWLEIKNGIDLARTSSLSYLAAMQAALDIVDSIKNYWNELNGKTYTTYHRVITVTEGTPQGAAIQEAIDVGKAITAANNAAAEVAPTDEEQAKIDADIKAAQAEIDKIAADIKAAHEAASAANAANLAALNAKLNYRTPAEIAALAKQNAQYAAQAAGWASRGRQAGGFSSGGMVPKYFGVGGFARGTDTVPAMLTPGEFVMSKYAVDSHGVDTMKAINNGESIGNTVYNYELIVNVKSDSNPDQIANVVLGKIRQIDSMRVKGNRI